MIIFRILLFYDIEVIRGFVYIKESNNCVCLPTDNSSIILAEGVCFNGVTYMKSTKLYREGNIIINGTLVLDDSKLIIKSNLKNDWTKERAEEDAVDFIYNGQIDKIFDYSKLTGIGYREINKLITDYREKEMTGYYEVNEIDKWSDREEIFDKAKKYGIPYESVLIKFLDNKQEETFSEKMFSLMDRLLTVNSFVLLIIGMFAWFRRKNIYPKLKRVFRYFFRD